jgi:putative N6-adenine-specific DNA methylase
MANPPRTRFELFASTAPGLESIAAGELKSLGVRGRQEVGGVAFAGDLETMYRSNLWLRTAGRVVVRLGQFHASTFYELERRVKKLPWREFLPEAGEVSVRATCRKSRLYHSDAVAERVLEAIARVAPAGVSLKASLADRKEEGDDESGRDESSQIFVVRIVHDQVEISADSSGDLLHRRGYRRDVAKAPLRETLAAAMVLASGWQKEQPLLDPLCGAGTIPIEAALIARRIAPGIARNFQFMKWPGFDARAWGAIHEEARQAETNPQLDIRAADRDEGAIAATTSNAERARVGSDIRAEVAPLSDSLATLADLAGSEGWIISNPPYGIRIGDQGDLRDLYATIGKALRTRLGWRLGLLTADATLAGQLRIPLRSRFDSRNGGIPVSFLVSEKSRKPVGDTAVRD